MKPDPCCAPTRTCSILQTSQHGHNPAQARERGGVKDCGHLSTCRQHCVFAGTRPQVTGNAAQVSTPVTTLLNSAVHSIQSREVDAHAALHAPSNAHMDGASPASLRH